MRNEGTPVTWEQLALVLTGFGVWIGWASMGLISVQKSVALLEFSVFHKTAAVSRPPSQTLWSSPLLVTPEEPKKND